MAFNKSTIEKVVITHFARSPLSGLQTGALVGLCVGDLVGAFVGDVVGCAVMTNIHQYLIYDHKPILIILD